MKIGILGGGQLARMLALAAYPLGIETLCYEPTANTCANFVTQVQNASFEDEKQLFDFAHAVDLITFETENIPLKTIQILQKWRPIYPSLKALSIGQDRLLEKNLFKELNIPTSQFFDINTLDDLENAVKQTSLPAILKTRRMGYDGKGQFLLRSPDDLKNAWEILGKNDLILESFVNFDRELSIISVRDHQGNIVFYPLVHNYHSEGILRLSIAPYHDDPLQKQAQQIATKILENLNYVGVFVVELFQVQETLYANEMAPRVHNSGHWTIEGAVTSQFENHLRAITNLPLGKTTARGHSAMFNCVGTIPAIEDILKIPDTHFHTYQKLPKPNRKIGHITLNTLNEDGFIQKIESLKELI